MSSAFPPSNGSTFPVVGIGASAGGLESLERFFRAVPRHTGMAFVVIQHLSPDFRSVMDELLARYSVLRVCRAEDGIAVAPDTVYVMPPGKEMILANGRLRLTDKDPSQSLTLPIDRFFRSLAADRDGCGAAIVMSGSGSDGARGIADVRAAGGLVIAETEETATFDGMPGSARRSGAVHLVLPPEEMPLALMSWAERGDTRGVERVLESYRSDGVDDEGTLPVLSSSHTPAGQLADEGGLAGPWEEPALAGMDDLLELLRRDYDVDFSHYKRATVLRRIERRLALVGQPTVAAYVDVLRRQPGELKALYADLLIGVTCFFRDRECFDRLESDVLPRLVAAKGSHDELRIWVAGCATGEEAYSLGIVADEAVRKVNRPISLKIFATDVNQGLLETAGRGMYDESRLEGMSEERRERYFVRRQDGYQVVQSLRQSVVFAPHNVLRDAPFTNLDLVSCRNLLIYLQPHAQKKALLLFHFGLRAGGVLFLGSSESPGDLAEEFDPIDTRCRLYSKRSDVRLVADFRLPVAAARPRVPDPRVSGRSVLPAYDALLDRFMPPAFLVTDRRELVDCFAGAEQYLRMRPRRPSQDLLELVPAGLRTPLAGLFQRAPRRDGPAAFASVRVAGGDGAERQVRLGVEPVRTSGGESYYLVTLAPEELARDSPRFQPPDATPVELSEEHLHAVEDELRTTRSNLQATIEELETSNEELQATNEELVASNEELQSTNEELHSVNEELYSVNAEYQRKIQELSELNRDMSHLLEATDVATLFLDGELRIRRFTPRIAGVFDLVPSDIGRSITSFTPRIRYAPLLEELRDVLRDARPREREVHGEGRSYLLRLLPYRVGDTVDGVVLSLVDVTVLEEARRDLSRLSAIVQSTDDAIIGKSPDAIITSWNAAAEALYGFSAAEAIGQHISLCVPPERAGETNEALERVLSGERVSHYETVRVRKDGRRIDVSVSVSPVLDEDGAVVGVSSITRDITARKQAERREKVEHAVARLAAEATSIEEVGPRLVQALRENLGVDAAELYLPDGEGRLAPVGAWGEPEGSRHTDGADAGWPEQARQLKRTIWFADVPTDGSHSVPPSAARLGFRSGFAFPVLHGDECLAVASFYTREPMPPGPQLLATVSSISQTIGQLIRRSRAESELRAAVVRRDRFLAMLSHELRNPLAAVRTAVIALQRNHLKREARHAAYDVIARQVRHMSLLLDDLLDVSRVTQDRLKLQPERFDIAGAITAAVEMVAPMARERDIAVTVERGDGALPVTADLARITQMLANLLANAVKYSPPGSQVRLRAERDGKEAVLTVIDHGVGMTKEVLERAFDLFYQADETLDRRQSGMGVGLTLARAIATLHGGTLAAASDGPGQGSRFTARLPLADVAGEEERVDECGPSVERYRIVLVEDHEDNREMIRLLLGCEGHQVETAASGAEGVSLIERTRPDVALLDIGLPGMDGFEVAQRIRQNPQLNEVGLVALSGYAQASDIEKGRQAGFDAHVAKPMTPEHLLEVVEKVVASRQGAERR